MRTRPVDAGSGACDWSNELGRRTPTAWASSASAARQRPPASISTTRCGICPLRMKAHDGDRTDTRRIPRRAARKQLRRSGGEGQACALARSCFGFGAGRRQDRTEMLREVGRALLRRRHRRGDRRRRNASAAPSTEAADSSPRSRSCPASRGDAPRAHVLEEFDLDAMLCCAGPRSRLIDELAHTNAPG